ncbi:MAG: Mut7-C RNAse domain-containing protein, partial [Desulfuromonadales bacterium]|nr:Mut7-C RNAse domain-containing protein [Desulfuromonadales bacterium]
VFDAPCFILDVHLGKLARRLRLLGFDCLYRNDYADDDIVWIAHEEDRIILTRDRGLLKRKMVEQGCLLNSNWPDEQLAAANQRYGLIDRIKPLGRCPSCNGLLQPVEKEQVADRLQPKTLLYYETFRLCTDCGQIYWRGSHTERILRWIENFSRSG